MPIVENKRTQQFYNGSAPLSGNDLRPLRVFIDMTLKSDEPESTEFLIVKNIQ